MAVGWTGGRHTLASATFLGCLVPHETALQEAFVWPGAGGGGGAPGALAELGLGGGRRVRARLVVGADGPRSHVRQLAGAPCVPSRLGAGASRGFVSLRVLLVLVLHCACCMLYGRQDVGLRRT